MTPRELRGNRGMALLRIFGPANRRRGGNAESDRRRYRRDSALKPRLRAGFVRLRRPVMTWTGRSSWQTPTSHTLPHGGGRGPPPPRRPDPRRPRSIQPSNVPPAASFGGGYSTQAVSLP